MGGWELVTRHLPFTILKLDLTLFLYPKIEIALSGRIVAIGRSGEFKGNQKVGQRYWRRYVAGDSSDYSHVG